MKELKTLRNGKKDFTTFGKKDFTKKGLIGIILQEKTVKIPCSKTEFENQVEYVKTLIDSSPLLELSRAELELKADKIRTFGWKSYETYLSF